MINYYLKSILFVVWFFLPQISNALEDEAAIITLSLKTDVSCNGLSDGSATFALVGLGPFNYNLVGITTGSTTAVIGVLNFDNLSAGDYTLIVEDENLILPSIFDTLVFTINEPAPLMLNPDIDHINCNNPTASVELNITGGSGSYTSLLDGVLVTLGVGQILDVTLGTHLLQITDSNGCEAEEEIDVQEIPDPVIDLGASLSLGCLDLLDLTASVTGGGGSNNFIWTTVNGNILNTAGATATISLPGTYTAEVTDANGCTSQDQVVVTADIELPIIDLAATVSLGCLDSRTISADVDAGIQLTWTTDNGQIVGSSSGSTIEVSAPGIYIATALNLATGCESSKSIEVTADISLPTLNLGADVNLGCLSQLALNASVESGVEVSWVTSNGSILGSTVGASILINAPGTYIATAVNLLGCETTDEINVIAEVDLPSINLGADVNLGCLADLDLTANVGTGTQVDWLTLDGSILGSSLGLTITVDAPGTYLAIATNALGCQDTDQIVVHADINLPSINLGADVNLGCLADLDLTANVGTGTQVAWLTLDGSILGSSLGTTVKVNAPGTYIAIATNALGCQDTDQIVVHADINLPSINLGADLEISCSENLTLIADLASTLNIDVLWYALGGGHILGSNQGPIINVNQPGTYVAVATNLLTNCSSSDTINITGDVGLLDIDLGVDLTLGCGESLTLEAILPLGLDVLVEWSTLNGRIVGSVLGKEVTIDLPGVYIATAIDILGCSISDTITIFGENPIDLNLGPDTIIGCNDTLLITPSNSNLLNLEIQWKTEGGNIIGDLFGHEILLDKPGLYIAVAIDLLSGCSGSDTIVVIGNNIDVNLGPDQNLDCEGLLTIMAAVTGSSNPSYSWQTTGGNIVGPADGPAIQVDKAGNYTVEVSDPASGCSQSDAILVLGAPSLSISGDANVELSCGESYVATASISGAAGLSINWMLDGNLIDENTSQITISSPGTYVALAIDGECTISDTLHVNGTGLSVTIETEGEISCNGPVQLNAQIGGDANLSATWTTPDGTILASNTNELIVEGPGIYIATVVDDQGECSASDTIELNTLGLSVNLGPDVDLSCGESFIAMAEINGSNSVIITWQTLEGALLALNTDQLLIETPGTFVVIVEDPINGCSDSDTLQVSGTTFSVDPGPEVPLACGGTVTLQAIVDNPQNVVFNWSTVDGEIIGTSTGAEIEVGSTGSYIVIAEDTESGCKAIGEVIVFQEGIGPEITVSEDQSLLCQGMNQLSVMLNEQGNYEVYWSTLDGVIDEIDGMSILISQSGVYNVEVVDPVTGCSSKATIHVFPNPECDSDSTDNPGGTDTTLISCNPYYFSPPVIDTTISYTVTQVSGLCSGSIFPVGTTEIVFIISYETGDFDVVSWDVTVKPFEVMAEILEPSCFGESDGQITLLLPEAHGPYQLRWNNTGEQKGLVADSLSAGSYNVSGLAANGCIINQTFHLCQPDPLTLKSGITISETDELSDGAINITAAGGTAPYKYEWYLEGELVSHEEDLYFVPAGNYTLILTDAKGCSRTWTDLIISRITSEQAYSLFDQVNYPTKLVRYIKVFPNPSAEEVNLELELKGEAEIEINLLNQLGELLQVVPKIYSDQQQFQFSLGDYADGIYHLMVKVNDMIYVKKILILH